jgi:UDP-N-acetylmuramate dehydrogenase
MPKRSKDQIVQPEIKKNVTLDSLNTLGVKSTAALFTEVTEKEQLSALAKVGFFKKEPPYTIGGGSNILLTSNPTAPVMKISIPGIKIVEETGDHILVKTGAGVEWHTLVKWAVDRGFGGIENLALIPGTAGAAPIQNIGAYGVELEHVFYELEAFLTKTGVFKRFHHDECMFGYRDSIFKKELKNIAIVCSVTLKLNKEPHFVNTEYYALQSFLDDREIHQPTISDVFNAVIAIRQSKLPDPALLGNAGSFFKNPVVDHYIYDALKKDHMDIPSFPATDGMVKIPAGWLIEQAGWKGRRVGDVGTYENQALVIVNHGNATGEEIYQFAMDIRKSVRDKFGIELTPEVNILN